MKKFLSLIAVMAIVLNASATGEFFTEGRATLVKYGLLSSSKTFLMKCNSAKKVAYKSIFGDKYDLMVAGGGEWTLGKSKGGEKNYAFIGGKAVLVGTLKAGVDIVLWRADASSEWVAVLKIGDNGCLNPLESTHSYASADGVILDDKAGSSSTRTDSTVVHTGTGSTTVITHVYCGGHGSAASTDPDWNKVWVNEPTPTYWAQPAYQQPVVVVQQGGGWQSFAGDLVGGFLGGVVSHKRHSHNQGSHGSYQGNSFGGYQQATYHGGSRTTNTNTGRIFGGIGVNSSGGGSTVVSPGGGRIFRGIGGG